LRIQSKFVQKKHEQIGFGFSLDGEEEEQHKTDQ
jgi:hypothetical protein